VAHEINHAMMHAVETAFQTEQIAFHGPDIEPEVQVRSSPAAGPVSAIVDRPLNDINALARFDGVSSYSHDWWNNAYQSGMVPSVVVQAIRETLAEIANKLYNYPKGTKNPTDIDKTAGTRRVRLMKQLAPPWRALYRAVQQAYPLTKGKTLPFQRPLPGLEDLT
jgi:hypothetical protein